MEGRAHRHREGESDRAEDIREVADRTVKSLFTSFLMSGRIAYGYRQADLVDGSRAGIRWGETCRR